MSTARKAATLPPLEKAGAYLDEILADARSLFSGNEYAPFLDRLVSHVETVRMSVAELHTATPYVEAPPGDDEVTRLRAEIAALRGEN